MRAEIFPATVLPRSAGESNGPRLIKRRSRANLRRVLVVDDGRRVTSQPLRKFTFPTVVSCLFLLVLLLGACVSAPALNCNLAADEHDRLARDPDLQWNLWMREIPQDDQLHFAQQIKRLHDPKSNDPIGWSFQVSVKCAWPVSPSTFSLFKRRKSKAKATAPDLPWSEPTPIPGNHRPLYSIIRPPYPRKTYPPDEWRSLIGGEIDLARMRALAN